MGKAKKRIVVIAFILSAIFVLAGCDKVVLNELEQEMTQMQSEQNGQNNANDPDIQKVVDKNCDFTPPSESVVSIVQSDTVQKAGELTYEDIEKLVREAVLQAGGLNSIVSDGDTVVLKPNLVTSTDYTYPKYKGKPLSVEVNGNCTDYRVTRAVAKIVRELNPKGKIYVAEGSAMDTLDVMKRLKYTKQDIPEVDEFYAIENESGAKEDFASPRLVKVNLKGGYLHPAYYMNRIVYDADVVISLPTLKNHWHAVVTGGIKNVSIGTTPSNIYGSNSNGRTKKIEHTTTELHKFIADYYMARPVDFVVMDGLQGIENGPTPSYEVSKTTDITTCQKNMRLIMAGSDAVAVDTVETNIINWDYTTVPYLTYLAQKGVGNSDTAKITVTGNRSVDDVRSDFAGVLPPAGGKKLSDKTPPKIGNVSAKCDQNTLIVSYQKDSDAKDAEVYINGKLFAWNLEISGTINLDVSSLDKGSYPAEIRVYDQFMNASKMTLTFQKTAPKTEPIVKGNYTAKYAGGKIQINGVGDEAVWNSAEWAPIDEVWLGTTPDAKDFSGRYKMLWDEEALYYLVEIHDDVLSETRPDPLDEYYNEDTLELFIDENRSGGEHKNNYNAFAYHISTLGDVVDINADGKPQLFNDHITSKWTQQGDKYIWEVRMKVFGDTYSDSAGTNVAVRLTEGKKLGYAVAYCDADESRKREHFIGSVAISGKDKNIAWIDAGVFGELTLLK